MTIFRYFTVSAVLTVALLLGGSIVSAQGNDAGGGGGRPGGSPAANPGSKTTTPQSSSGKSSTSSKSGKSSSKNSTTSSRNGNGNMPSDAEMSKYRGISTKMGTTTDVWGQQYHDAYMANNNLKFGQFVTANVVADDLHSRYPNVTSEAILAGYRQGHSIDQTLRSMNVDAATAKAAEKNAERRIKESQKGM
jgi:hypothetical protein